MMITFTHRALALAAAIAASCALAQPSMAPPPPPPEQAPAAQPPRPSPSTGTLTQSPRGAEARAGEASASRWQGALDRLDADLRLRLLTADHPPEAWLAGELDATDIESKVRHYTAARTAAPGEALYQASLAIACLAHVRPPLAQCEAVDRLADWARRDTGNGLPEVLLADRARQRGELDAAASYVEEAAAAPRFDDYWSQGAALWWNYLRTAPLDAEPAARAKAAANYASERDLAWAAPLRALCAERVGRSDRMKAACERLGTAMMTRGATFALQRAGARVAEINAPDAKARAAAQLGNARVLEAAAQCAQAQPDFETGLESSMPAARARAVDRFAAWASAQAKDGEVGACQRARK
ncbi:MAG: hypothetical protein ACM3JC_13135 [Rudaea sp.]